MKHVAVSLALLLAAGCSGAPDQETGGSAPEAPAAAAPVEGRPAAFTQCGVCHSVKPDGKHGLGPNLRGVFGTKAGASAGFKHSAAMKASGLTWDGATLDRYLADPRAAVPGTKMAYTGMSDATKRAAIIGWLKTLKAPPPAP